MELDQLAKRNYFVRYDPRLDIFEVLSADRSGTVTIVQTNMKTEAKANKACEEWCDREMQRMVGEIVDLMAGMMRIELERQREETGRNTADLRLLAAASLMAMQLYIRNNAPASQKN